jgi:hypothetical protein
VELEVAMRERIEFLADVLRQRLRRPAVAVGNAVDVTVDTARVDLARDKVDEPAVGPDNFDTAKYPVARGVVSHRISILVGHQTWDV